MYEFSMEGEGRIRFVTWRDETAIMTPFKTPCPSCSRAPLSYLDLSNSTGVPSRFRSCQVLSGVWRIAQRGPYIICRLDPLSRLLIKLFLLLPVSFQMVQVFPGELAQQRIHPLAPGRIYRLFVYRSVCTDVTLSGASAAVPGSSVLAVIKGLGS